MFPSSLYAYCCISFFRICISLIGYTFYEAHEVVPLDIETNYPDILSILMPNAEDDAENVVLQVQKTLIYGIELLTKGISM